MIALGSDHGGFALKEYLKKHLLERGFEVRDFGCFSPESCDYPDIALEASRAVAEGECEGGILCCGTGIGISIAANKIKGIRAAVVGGPTVARLAKEHNNANIICLGGRITGELLAEETVDAWLDAEFMGGRHQTRVDKISGLEAGANPQNG